MKRLATVQEIRQQVKEWKTAGLKVGLVPTMGNLHRGHVRLAERALESCDRIVVSVFVNPTQFGEHEDFDAYPRTVEDDQKALEVVCGEDALFAPSVAEMYPGGEGVTTTVTVPEVSDGMCGDSRPGHFEGVATVVSRLFNIVMPDLAVFGQKDYQQVLVIKRLTRDLCFPIEIISEPTVREDSGLAMSSRNRYLTNEERKKAPLLRKLILEMAEKLSSGERDYGRLQQLASANLLENGWVPDYFEIRRADDLAYPHGDETELVILAAAYMGSARLLDNFVVTT